MLFAMLVITSPPLLAKEIAGLKTQPVVKRPTIDYTAYDALLKATVNERGEVNYRRLVQRRDELRSLVQEFLNSDPTALQSQDEKLAFYINVYNAVTLYQVTLHYPIGSVMYNFPGGEFFKNTFPLGSKTIYLDYLQKDILQKEFKNPYIHFAINCASASCPILENRAWQAQGLQARLKAAARRYLGDPRYARYDSASLTLYLSELFKWYPEDFGNPIAFYNKVTGKKIPLGAQVHYLPYDWSLNEKIP